MTTETQKLVEQFNEWADERIFVLEDMPMAWVEKYRSVQRARIDALHSAKQNLERLAKEV